MTRLTTAEATAGLQRWVQNHDAHVRAVAGETDEQAWCIRCDHPARIWPEARVFIASGTPCHAGAEA